MRVDARFFEDNLERQEKRDMKKKSAPKKMKKIEKVMGEYKRGTLHSGKKGAVVKSRKQAVAIAMSEAGMAKKKGKK